jgi:hypothetical protein
MKVGDCDGEPIGIIEKSENIVFAIRRMSDRSDHELSEYASDPTNVS